jgi:hypothetical protein
VHLPCLNVIGSIFLAIAHAEDLEDFSKLPCSDFIFDEKSDISIGSFEFRNSDCSVTVEPADARLATLKVRW